MDTKIEALLKWVKNTEDESFQPSTHTYISPKTIVKDDQEWGRGIVAIEHVRNRELLMRIPPSFLLNYTTVLKHITSHNKNISLSELHYTKVYVPQSAEDEFTKIYSLLELEELTNFSSFQLLAFYITMESQRSSRSFWKPFLDMLPPVSDFELVPLTWYVLKVPQFQTLLNDLPPSVKRHANDVIKRFTADYEVVKSFLTAKIARAVASESDESKGLESIDVSQILPESTFLWAWICINSRCLYMDIPQKKNNADNFTMAPYVDFLNHSSEDQCSLKIDATGFQVYTGQSYKPNEQIFLSYGPHSNEFLLCEYGFMLQENKWNDLNVSHYIEKLLSAQQAEYLKTLDYYGEYTINVESGPSFRTEVALATLQEPSPAKSRKLQALVNGLTDGSSYEKNSKILLDEILQLINHEIDATIKRQENEAAGSDDSSTKLRKKVISKLNDDIKEIIQKQKIK